MSHAAQFDMNANQGAAFDRLFKLQDGNGQTNISAYTFTAKIKTHYTASASVAFTVTVTNASQGEFRLTLTDAQTSAMAPGTWVYDLIADDGVGGIDTLIRGYLTVEPGVSL